VRAALKSMMGTRRPERLGPNHMPETKLACAVRSRLATRASQSPTVSLIKPRIVSQWAWWMPFEGGLKLLHCVILVLVLPIGNLSSWDADRSMG